MPTWSISVARLDPRSYPRAFRRRPKKAKSQEIGRSRGRLTTKLPVAVAALDNPRWVILSVGQIADQGSTRRIHRGRLGLRLECFFIESITAQSSQAIIPPRSNRLKPRTFDKHIYTSRNLIERFFSPIKPFRRIATRYVLSVVHSYRMRFRLAGVIANTP